MNEYLQLMSRSDNLEGDVTGLLRKWAGRYPHPKLDPVPVWDDIVTGRCMMMNKVLQRLHEQTPSSPR